jgi:hypothetical protein
MRFMLNFRNFCNVGSCNAPPTKPTAHTRQPRHQRYYAFAMKFEDWPEEWQEWAKLTPLERFRESEKIFAQYLAMGGSLDPDPDPTSPFYDPETSGSGAAYGRPGLRVLRRSPV